MSDEFEGVFKDEDSPNDLFNEATIYVRKKTSEISKENLLYLYGRYKYAHEGPCNTSRPGGILNLEAKSKWDSWNSVEKNLTKEKAKEQYIAKLDGLFPKWKDTTDSKKISDQFSKADQAGTFGNKTSTMTKEIIKDSDKNCFDLCREGLVDKLKDYLVNNPNSVDQTDENDMTMSMWACKINNKFFYHTKKSEYTVFLC
jgi:acyl-CoA-binding protein